MVKTALKINVRSIPFCNKLSFLIKKNSDTKETYSIFFKRIKMRQIIEWSRMLLCLTVAKYGMSVYLSFRSSWVSAPRSLGDAKQGVMTGVWAQLPLPSAGRLQISSFM